jgi:septum formation protein
MARMEPVPVILASQSPRRRRLLPWLGAPFDVLAVDTPEDLDTPLASHPPALAESLAAEKAEAARADGTTEGALVLGFDTLVVHDGALLGKPRDVQDAWRMLRALSGATHQVVTGCAVLCPDATAPAVFSVVTEVTMKPLTDCQIEAWMAMGSFMGCAGAYNIEAQVAEVTEDECYQNVAGLPLCHLLAAVRELPHGCRPDGLASPVALCDHALGRRCRLGPAILGEPPR